MIRVYRNRLVELFALERKMLAEGASDRDLNLVLYLTRRAWRPVYQQLRADYVKLWGQRCTFSYFFPELTRAWVWRRARRIERRLAE